MLLALVRKRRPDCHCFGALHSAPVSGTTVARTGGLAAVAWTAATFEATAADGNFLNESLGSLVGGQRPIIPALIAVGALVVFIQGWFILHLLRQQGRLLVRIERLEATEPSEDGGHRGLQIVRPETARAAPDRSIVGSAAPMFALESVEGDTVTLEILLEDGHRRLLAFIDPQCGPCVELLPTFARWSHGSVGGVPLTVIASGDRDTAGALAGEYRLRGMLLDNGEAVMNAFGVYATPTVLLVGADGRIASPPAGGGVQIRDLLRRIAGDCGARVGAAM